MAINYTYPVKGQPVIEDEFLIVDTQDGNATKRMANLVKNKRIHTIHVVQAQMATRSIEMRNRLKDSQKKLPS